MREGGGRKEGKEGERGGKGEGSSHCKFLVVSE